MVLGNDSRIDAWMSLSLEKRGTVAAEGRVGLTRDD